MKNTQKRLKYLLALGSLVLLFPVIASESSLGNQNELNAATLPFTAPTFNNGDKVNLGNLSFTTLSTNTDIKLLADNPTKVGDTTYADAQSSLQNMSDDYGTLGATLLQGITTLPTKADLLPYTVPDTTHIADGSMLNSSIPNFSKDWWLGDAPLDYKVSFVSPDNRLSAPISRTQTAFASNNSCTTEVVIENGIKQSETRNDGPATMNGKYTGYVQTYILNEDDPTRTSYDADVFVGLNCDDNLLGGRYNIPHNGASNIEFENDLSTGNLTHNTLNFPYFYLLNKEKMQEMSRNPNGFVFHIKLDVGVCYGLPKVSVPNGVGGTFTGDDQSFKILPFGNETSINLKQYGKNSIGTHETISCPGQPQTAGLSSVRPYISLPQSMVALGNQSKRTYTPSTSISNALPTSDGTDYLTLQAPSLGVSLTSGAKGVNGNEITIDVGIDGSVSIPVSLTGNAEGNKYVSAIANDKSGNQAYGVLGKIDGTEGTLDLNVSNLVDLSSAKEVNLTLYQENAGSYNTSYIGTGTPITIKFLAKQEIEFDASQATSVTYGNDITITSSLKSTLSEQEATDITYSIVTPEGQAIKAEVVSQSYNRTTGKATATIRPLTGTGTFTVAINKAGKSNGEGTAFQKTMELTLERKAIDITPVIPSKVYKIGDNMPSLTSASTGLVRTDTIPSSVVPILTPLGTSAIRPDSGGRISEVGTWKMTYSANILDGLTEFTDKYNVHLIGYDDAHKTYVFETGIDTIPADWVVVSPAANSDGWNSETVTISPSDSAKAAGYTTIEELNASDQVLKTGATITYSAETIKAGITPKVRLKKGESTSSSTNTRTIKIDLTVPTGSMSIANENEWVDKETGKLVSVSASDALSGIQSVTATIGGTAVSLDEDAGSYSFSAKVNGEVVFTITDKAGKVAIIKKTVAKIEAGEISITATPQDNSSDKIKQLVAIVNDPGSSGVKGFKVYYKKDVADVYIETQDLGKVSTSFNFTAQMNGWYKFEIENNVGSKESAEVHLTTITPPTPVTQIAAVLNSNQATTYKNDTWTSDDVLIKLSNMNDEITDAVTWTVSSNDGITYTPVDANATYLVSTGANTTLNKKYLFKAKSSLDMEESVAREFTVKIDKTKPNAPTVVNAQEYVDSAWFSEDVTIETTISPRPNGAPQVVYYQLDGVEKWNVAVDGKYTVSGNGKHQIVFKVIDEAGNESDKTAIAYVNINSSSPTITISLQGDPIKELINELTFGFFFKNTVNVDFTVNYGLGGSGKVFYIIEDAEGSSMPEDTDPRWVRGESTTISPEKKVMIYAKAVSDSDVISKESSVYYVVADAVKPIVTLPANATTWTNETTMNVVASDANAGIDQSTLQYSAKNVPLTTLAWADNKAVIKNLEDGQYQVRVVVKDYSDNSQDVSTTVKIDTVYPEVGNPASSSESWTTKKTISFTASDALSGLDTALPVVSVGGKNVKVTLVSTGKYSFEVVENGTYSIVVKDKAGNKVTKTHVEEKIDTIKPVISNKAVDDPDGWKASKKVSFDAVDSESGIDSVIISYVVDGETKTMIATPGTAPAYSFNATEEGTYTITVTDEVGNVTTDSIVVSNIDASGISISDISDISKWVKDKMTVSFAINAGFSGVETGYPKVTYKTAPLPLKMVGSKYAFDATENGEYTITLKNKAGEEVSEVINIQKIDTLSPVIDQVSSNITSDEYRGPQVITFHVSDNNGGSPQTMGSGMKSGYPKVYYMENGQKRSVGVTQDTHDKTLYKFTASKNVTYIVEAIDGVEHPLVSENIVVDHILNPSDVSEVKVIATSKGKNISSNVWASGDVTFTLSGGLSSDLLTSYQVAISDGQKPTEDDWLNISDQGTNQHIVTDEQTKKTYWFRTVPLFDKAVSKPFVVNLDNTAPVDVQINVERKNTGRIAKFINALSFGNWLNEEQVVTFTANDNYTDLSQLKFQYVEEKDGTRGNWKTYSGSLSYLDTELNLFAKATDLAGNESDESDVTTLQIDTVKPVVSGVEDKSVYKFYYVKRTITYSDALSGVDDTRATITNDGSIVDLSQGYQVGAAGEYTVSVFDNAGNENIVHFKLVPLPDIETEIDGSDESKGIIDQVQKELDEERENLSPDEIKDYEDWIKDATDKWNDSRKTVVEDEDKTSKVEGIGDTNFDPSTILVVEPIEESSLPALPRKALYSYDVYLLRGKTQIQPNGDVKVYLPYQDVEQPIVYEIDESDKVSELETTTEPGHVIFTTKKLLRYAISNVKQPLIEDVCVVGPDGILGTADDVCGAGSDDKDPEKDEEGSVEVPPGGNVTYPDGGVVETPDGGIIHPDGSLELPNGDVFDPEGNKKLCKLDGIKVNVDSDGDGKIDINVDIDGDCEADINIDSDHDGQPESNIDSDGDGEADYNIDVDGDGKPDINIGPIRKPWEPSLCQSVGEVEFCTDSYRKPYINIDTDKDGRADVNLDVDSDMEPDLNIDLNDDNIPDIDIDIDGDGKADINVDVDHDGIADINLVMLTKWTPDKDAEVNGFKYDTMSDLKPVYNIDTDGDNIADENLADNSNNQLILSGGKVDTSIKGAYTPNSIGGAGTGDGKDWTQWWIMMLISSVTLIYSVCKKVRMKQQQ